ASRSAWDKAVDMRVLTSLAFAVAILGASAFPSQGQDKPTPTPARDTPPGVRELTLDIPKCERTKKGPSVAVCTTRDQLEVELGKEAGNGVWGQIDPKTEAVVVLGIWDTYLV